MNLEGERLQNLFLMGIVRARTPLEKRRLSRWFQTAMHKRKLRASKPGRVPLSSPVEKESRS